VEGWVAARLEAAPFQSVQLCRGLPGHAKSNVKNGAAWASFQNRQSGAAGAMESTARQKSAIETN